MLRGARRHFIEKHWVNFKMSPLVLVSTRGSRESTHQGFPRVHADEAGAETRVGYLGGERGAVQLAGARGAELTVGHAGWRVHRPSQAQHRPNPLHTPRTSRSAQAGDAYNHKTNTKYLLPSNHIKFRVQKLLSIGETGRGGN